MRTADEQRGGDRRECQRRAGAPRRSHYGAMVEQMGESEGERGQTDGRGRLFSFTVSLLMGILPCRCNTPHLNSIFFFSCSIIIIITTILIIMTTTMLKKYI